MHIQVLSLMGALPLAVKNEQSCLDILAALYPGGDARVEEARQWLQHFTVMMSKVSKDKAGICYIYKSYIYIYIYICI